MVSADLLPPRREVPRPPPPAVEAAEKQWIFTEEELNQTPSILDGMSPEEERTLRKKGVNFTFQVGMMLKLPQTTLSVAALFFNRYLMRNTLVTIKGRPKPLHHYQAAATALFLASKNEENVRKMKELVVACVRVALKDPNKNVDEQTKDYWRWRDTILYNEDVLLESLCFDLNVEPPYKTLFEMLKYYGIEHNKRLRNAAWAFLSDSCMTQLCLLFTSRTIAAAALYAAARLVDMTLPDEDGRPWWEVQYVRLADLRRACCLMSEIYEGATTKDGEQGLYTGLRSPEGGGIDFDSDRSGEPDASLSQGPSQPQGVDSNRAAAATTNGIAANGIGANANANGTANGNANGDASAVNAAGAGAGAGGGGTDAGGDGGGTGGAATERGSEEGELDG